MEALPYTVHPREDTGLFNAKVGIWLFLASEVMLFGALFSSYILLRVGSAVWPQGWLNVPIGTANTIVLITSSITVVMAWASLKMNNFNKFKLFQACTLILAMTFVVIKSFEYRDKFSHYEVIQNDGKIIDGHLKSRDKETVVIHGHVAENAAQLLHPRNPIPLRLGLAVLPTVHRRKRHAQNSCELRLGESQLDTHSLDFFRRHASHIGVYM